MKNLNKTSITDLPKIATEDDSFGIKPFENGLIRFIQNTNTPITIALQGEWGSGKTSLMNSLRLNLTESDNSKYHSVWLNTWEYSLMKDAQSTLLDIISGLIKETSNIAGINDTQTKKIIGKLMNIGKTTLKFASKTVADKVVSGSSEIIDSLYSETGKSSITEIRTELENIIENCIKKDNKEGFIFFIDDLDRIDPPIAVELLELLKNIFTLKNCIFILAIDYDVVIKGLEPKFGKLTSSNEREFRSFFDKIIQVPFSMPVSSYEVNKFLKESLLSTSYLTEEQIGNDELINDFAEISNLTVGTNPRALKRLMNSLSLISCISFEKDNGSELNNDLELLVNFALVSIQIAYPPFYRLLVSHSDFDKWDEKIALLLNLKELDENSKEKLKNSGEYFDEEWEQIVYRICEDDFYLKKKTLNISMLLNLLKSTILDKGKEIESTISAIISLSSVTSIEAFDVQEVSYHKGNLLKSIKNKLLPLLRTKMPEISNQIKQQGTRIQSNFRFKLSENGNHWIKIHSHQYEGKIRLIIHTSKWLGKIKTNNYKKDWQEKGIYDKFNIIEKEFDEFIKSLHQITSIKLTDYIDKSKKQNVYTVNFFTYLILPNSKDFKSEQSIEILSKLIIGMYGFMQKLEKLDVEHK